MVRNWLRPRSLGLRRPSLTPVTERVTEALEGTVSCTGHDGLLGGNSGKGGRMDHPSRVLTLLKTEGTDGSQRLC